MSTVDLLARIAIGWLTLSAIVVGAYMLAMARHKSRAARKPQSDPVFRIVSMYPPPLAWPMKRPPITQEQVDEAWLSIWPTEVDEDALMNREFVSLISAEWEWPDTAEGAA